MANPTGIADCVTLNNGVTMPWLGLGTWRVSEGPEVEQTVRMALDVGYRHIDTAAAYGNEEGVGKGVRASGVPRDQVFVTTKIPNPVQRQGPEAVAKQVDESLDKLGIGPADLILIHWPIKGHYKDTWAVLEQAYNDGKARAIGLSNFLIHHVEDLLAGAKVKPTVNQVEFHPRLLQRELLEFDKRNGIVHEAWSPLMRGRIGEIPELEQIARRHDKTVAQVALRWNLQHDVVTIPKSVHRERLEENAALFDFELTDEEMRQIDALDQGTRIGPDPDNVTF